MVRNYNWIIVLPLLGSLGLNLLFFLREIPVRSGGGAYLESPNSILIANAQSFININPLAQNSGVVQGNLELRIVNQHDPAPRIMLDVRPAGVENENGYRNLEKPISWSADSKTVTFDLPHMVVAVTPKMEHEIFSAKQKSNSQN